MRHGKGIDKTSLEGKCGSCFWSKKREHSCRVDCLCQSKRKNDFARTQKACGYYKLKVETE